jgi:hypothetical protein
MRRVRAVAVAATPLVIVGVLLLGGGGRGPLDGQAAVPTPTPAWPTPGPDATLVPELVIPPTNQAATILLGTGRDQAWAAVGSWPGDSVLWHRTANGWTRMTGTKGWGLIRSLASLPAGRLAVAADGGVFVSAPDGWTRVQQHSAMAIAVDAKDVLWVAALIDGGPEGTLHAYRETPSGWVLEWSGCDRGGNSVAVDADGSVWVAGITYSSLGGIGRVKDGVCADMSPHLRVGADEIASIAANPAGGIAAMVDDVPADPGSPAVHIIRWDGAGWTEIRAVAAAPLINCMAYTADGALWVVVGPELVRHAAGSWTAVASAGYSVMSAGPDGTLWYLSLGGAVAHIHGAPGASGAG